MRGGVIARGPDDCGDLKLRTGTIVYVLFTIKINNEIALLYGTVNNTQCIGII